MKDLEDNYDVYVDDYVDDTDRYEYDHDGLNYEAHTSTEDIEITFAGQIEHSDYGVPGSPVVSSIENISIKYLSILGVDVDPDKLPKTLISKLLDLSGDLEWEAV